MEKVHKNLVQRVWDFYRAAPYGITIIAFCTGSIELSKYGPYMDKIGRYEDMALTAMEISAILVGALLTRYQTMLRYRFEKDLHKQGEFDEVLFPPSSLTEWCDRQSALVAASSYGVEDKLRQHMENYKSQFEHPELPNF